MAVLAIPHMSNSFEGVRMLDWLGGEGVRLQNAFEQVFGGPARAFGKRSTWIGGLSDGQAGVQWNAGFDPRSRRQWIGVNLEGMKYDDWPVARLITRELKQPTLPDLIRRVGDTGHAELLWSRDYWQATSRPPIVEANIVPTPILLRRLSDSAWREALTGALACLDQDRGYHGRAVQSVTLVASGRRMEGAVSPHLAFVLPAAEYRSWEPFLREAKAEMQVFYDWTKERAAT